MKKAFFSFLTCLPILLMAGTPEQNNNTQNTTESTKISLYVPGFLMKAGSWFVKKEKDPVAKEALSKLRSTSIVVREGSAYKEYHASKKYDHKIHQLKRQNFEELVTVFDDDEKVTVQLRQNNKGNIRQVVVVADDGEESFVFLRLRCNVSMDDIKRWINSNQDVKDTMGQLLNT